MKTLLDALKIPDLGALPPGDVSQPGEDPLHCLLEDDCLIGDIAVSTDRLLNPGGSPAEVLLVIKVQTHVARVIHGNLGLL